MTAVSPLLGITQVDPAQNLKEVTINAAVAALESAFSTKVSVPFSGSNITLTSAQFASGNFFVASGNTTTLSLIVPLLNVSSNAWNRLFAVRNTGTATLTVKGATGATVTVGAGLISLVYLDGTDVLDFTGIASLLLSKPNSWTAAQRGVPVVLTDAVMITPDFAAGNDFSLLIGGNRTLANPTNIVAGQAGQIVVTQDGTGSRTLSFGSYWKFAGGTAFVLSIAAGAIDIMSYYVIDSSHIAVSGGLNFS